MSTTYSTRFFLGTLAVGTNELLFTVPSGYIAVVRDVSVFLPTSGTLFNVQVGSPGGQSVFWYLTSSSATYWTQWQGRQVLNAGDTLLAYSSEAGAQVIASGYLLTTI